MEKVIKERKPKVRRGSVVGMTYEGIEGDEKPLFGCVV